MASASRPWLLALAALVAACSSEAEPVGASGDEGPVEGPGFPIRYRTQYVDIAPSFTQPICHGSLEAIDRQIMVVASLLDIDVQDRPTVHWFNDHAEGTDPSADLCEWCSRCGSCYGGDGIVFSDRDALMHELVHAIVVPAWGRSGGFFNEGIAMGLDGDHIVFPRYAIELPTAIVGGSQHGGAHFTRWLVDRSGPAKLRAMFERTSPSSTKEEVLAEVQEVYGMTLAELEAEYVATAPTVYPSLGLCDGLEHVPRQGNRWELATTLDCDAPSAFGPRDEDGARELSVTLDLPTGIDEGFISVVEPDVSGKLVPCIDAPVHADDPDAVVQQWAVGNNLLFESLGGRYRFSIPVPEDGAIHVVICPWNGRHPTVGETFPDLCLDA